MLNQSDIMTIICNVRHSKHILNHSCNRAVPKQKNVVIARCDFHRGDPLEKCFAYLISLDTKWIASSQAPRNDNAFLVSQDNDNG